MFSFKNASPLRIKIVAGAVGVFVFAKMIGGIAPPSATQHVAEAQAVNPEQTAARAKWTKLRPDLDAHEYWARRCRPYADREISLPRDSMEKGFAGLALISCAKYERFETENTASMREFFEKGNDGNRLATPASLSGRVAAAQ
jgi:hypothetical protein